MKIVLFGPNGSGKGTQGSVLKEKYGLPHIESGAIFRGEVERQTPLGKEAQQRIDKGDLVPDTITIPMILNRLQEPDCTNGWILDGFPRNIAQAKSLYSALKERGEEFDKVVEIVLDAQTAKNRIMGRRICANDFSHANNVFIDELKPNGEVCRVCGGALSARPDDCDEAAIEKRHAIYYDAASGTLAAVRYFAALARNEKNMDCIELDGRQHPDEISAQLFSALQ